GRPGRERGSLLPGLGRWSMRQRFHDKVALVTGAGSGIGLATAEAFAREGASVAVNDRAVEKTEGAAERVRAAGGRVLAVVGDVSRGDECERIVRETIAGLGGLDILVNNAGIGAT